MKFRLYACPDNCNRQKIFFHACTKCKLGFTILVYFKYIHFSSFRLLRLAPMHTVQGCIGDKQTGTFAKLTDWGIEPLTFITDLLDKFV